MGTCGWATSLGAPSPAVATWATCQDVLTGGATLCPPGRIHPLCLDKEHQWAQCAGVEVSLWWGWRTLHSTLRQLEGNSIGPAFDPIHGRIPSRCKVEAKQLPAAAPASCHTCPTLPTPGSCQQVPLKCHYAPGLFRGLELSWKRQWGSLTIDTQMQGSAAGEGRPMWREGAELGGQ